ncbi:MAG TPA: PLP-dependent aminotransferase family protein [Thermoanaerobaculia bacterium]|nr:PLP-dependent aminotransferase family protein [Thermoanaerobaculia bacterium]
MTAPALTLPSLEPAPAVLLYEQVAERLQTLIEGGGLQPGDRAPSVRRLSRDLGVSISTVVQAYRLLEDRGLVEARAKSGFFVSARPLAPPPPAKTRSARRATVPETVELILRVRRLANARDLVPFGAAVASSSFLPIQPLHRALARAVREHPEEANAYDDLAGCPQLRRQLARRAMAAGCTLSPDEILTTSGAQQAVALCLRAVTRPGDVVAVESPTYFGLLEACAALHLKALEIATDPRDGICLDELEAALRRRRVAAVALAPSFGNPLGHCMPASHRRRLVELAVEHDVPIVEDDVYGDLHFCERRPASIKSFDRDDRVMLCSSFSKTLAPGYRVGWTAPGRYRALVERIKNASSVAAATAPQLAVARYLERGGYDRQLRKLRRVYRDLATRIACHVGEAFPAGTMVNLPQGGHVLWVVMPEPVSSVELFERALEQGIGVAPGPVFSASGRYRNCLRLNIALEWSPGVEQAILQLGRLAKRQMEPPTRPAASTATPTDRARHLAGTSFERCPLR